MLKFNNMENQLYLNPGSRSEDDITKLMRRSQMAALKTPVTTAEEQILMMVLSRGVTPVIRVKRPFVTFLIVQVMWTYGWNFQKLCCPQNLTCCLHTGKHAMK